MNTTVTSPESLLGELQKIAAHKAGKHGTPFKLRRASFKGKGLLSEPREQPRQCLRTLAGGRRGGVWGRFAR